MSTSNENTMKPDQDAVNSLRNLTASVQDLCSIIRSEHSSCRPDKYREELKAKDEITKTIYEQIKNGRPEKVPDWAKVELMPVDEIEKENRQYTQKYEDFWKDIDESTPLEKNAAVQAYTTAFSRFEEIYRLIGWRERDDEDAMFDMLVLTESRDLLIESIFGIEVYQMSRNGGFCERSRILFELSRLPRLLIILVRIACRQIHVSACGVDKPIKERFFDALTVVRVLALTARVLKGGLLASSLSLEKLLNLCHARRILDQPDASDVDTYHKQFDLLYDCLTALDFKRKFREIREPLCELFYLRYKQESIRDLFDRLRTQEEATIGIERYPELPLEENTDSTFHPEIFTIPYLQRFGRLNIEWTDCLDEHLKLYANRNSIRVFAHPTFFYNDTDLHK
ncbi:hypothetical protein EIK77_000344 [Talaromyces pinophilus]|nr:hypothetical protein EIK77_000344 [Talaromyces pinophilus]